MLELLVLAVLVVLCLTYQQLRRMQESLDQSQSLMRLQGKSLADGFQRLEAKLGEPMTQAVGMLAGQSDRLLEQVQDLHRQVLQAFERNHERYLAQIARSAEALESLQSEVVSKAARASKEAVDTFERIGRQLADSNAELLRQWEERSERLRAELDRSVERWEAALGRLPSAMETIQAGIGSAAETIRSDIRDAGVVAEALQSVAEHLAGVLVEHMTLSAEIRSWGRQLAETSQRLAEVAQDLKELPQSTVSATTALECAVRRLSALEPRRPSPDGDGPSAGRMGATF